MAYDAEIDGIYYDFNGTEASVTYKLMKSGTYFSDYSGDVIIPQSVTFKEKTYDVTSIGYRAFENCDKLTSVVIPNSVLSIGFGAFEKCYSLATIQIPESVTTIGGRAFDGTAWYGNQPDGVVYAGKVAYKYKGEMPENSIIEIKDGTISISLEAFNGYVGLTHISIPNSVTSIGSRAFDGTAWYDNQPDGVVYAGKVAYKYKGEMSENTTIDIKGGIVSIAEYAFDSCSGLKSINIPEGVTTIGEGAFRSCTNLTAVTIPMSVNNIGHSAFQSCYKLSSITIPEGVTSIGSHTFYNCSNLQSINIPESVKSIGGNVFEGCHSLQSLFIPKNVTYIGTNVIWGCSSLSSIIVDEGNSVFDSRNGCNAIIETSSNTLIIGCNNSVIPEGVTTIGDYAFYRCDKLQSLVVPKSVTSIGTYAFFGCSGLTAIEVESENPIFDSRNGCNAIIETSSNTLIIGCNNSVIPEGVTTIGDLAFYQCSGLTSINIPEGVTTIGEETFYDCSGLTSINIPEGVTTIGEGAFSGCSGLTSIIIPESVTFIGTGAFGGTAWFDNQPDGLVYAGKFAYRYKGTMPDNSTIEIKDGTLGIAGNAFSNSTGLTSIAIPNSVIYIGGGAFSGCKNLITINIPEKVTSIGTFTFNGCSSLTSIIIPQNVTRIGAYAFYDCTNLASIVIPEGVTSIENSAFMGCGSLTSINIPNGVTTIGDLAFYGCNNLTSIKIPESVTEIGYRAFLTLSSLTDIKVGMRNPVALLPETFWHGMSPTLYVPYGSKEAYQSAEYWSEFAKIIECNYIDVEDQTILAGNAITAEIGVNNFETNLVAFQMDLTLPEGVSIDKTGCSLSSRITDEEQELTIGKLESGAYRITSTSLSLTPISGNDGTLLSLKLTGEEGSIGGQATISNIIFSTAESEKIAMSDTVFNITVLNKYNLTYNVDGELYKTEVVVETTPLTPEAEPTKEGYTFGGWSEIPETMPNQDVVITGSFYLYGDVNTDEAVDVVDVVDIARFVVATPSANFREKLADLNFDEVVNIADAVTLVNHIVGNQNFVKAIGPKQSYNYDQCQLQLQSTKDNALSFSLDGDADFTAFQFEVELPQGVDVSTMKINGQRNDGHQLLFNKVADNRYRVAALSLSNVAFKGSEGELLNISIDGLPTEEISVQNILFVTQNGTSITFDGVSLSGTVTEIANVNVSEGNATIFDLQGRKLSELQRGVNIINGKKVYYNK